MFYNSGTVMDEEDNLRSAFSNFGTSRGGDAGDSHSQGYALSRSEVGDSGEGVQPRKSVTVITDADGNTIEISGSQRKYTKSGGNPPQPEGHEPCEIFCGRIPKEVLENELVPVFEKYGPVTDLRLMMNPVTNRSRGFAFVKYKNREDAYAAVRAMNGTDLRPGRPVSVSVCKPKLRLFVGNIPKLKGRQELFVEFDKRTFGLKDVIIYNNPDDTKKNRGFCFLEYGSHRDASVAKKRLSIPPMKIWGCDILVDWADPLEEPDDDVMSKVKVLYVRNITCSVTENDLRTAFGAYGIIDRVKKIKDYAFVHFHDRKEAAQAKAELDKKEFGGTPIEVTWAKPPTDKQKRQEILRAREKRMLQLFNQRPVKATENTAVTQMHMLNNAEEMMLRQQGMALLGSQAQGSGDNEYQHFEEFDEQDPYSEFDFHHQMAAGFQPAAFRHDGFGGAYSLLPRSGTMGFGWSTGPPPRRQTLANAFRQQEEQGKDGGLFSNYSVSQSGLATVNEEEPLPGFPLFQPRQTVSHSGTSTQDFHPAPRRQQRQKARGEGGRRNGGAHSVPVTAVDPIDADENWRANCGLPIPIPPRTRQQWTPKNSPSPPKKGEREAVAAVSETGTNATSSTPTPPNLSPCNSAPNVTWRSRTSSSETLDLK